MERGKSKWHCGLVFAFVAILLAVACLTALPWNTAYAQNSEELANFSAIDIGEYDYLTNSRIQKGIKINEYRDHYYASNAAVSGVASPSMTVTGEDPITNFVPKSCLPRLDKLYISARHTDFL